MLPYHWSTNTITRLQEPEIRILINSRSISFITTGDNTGFTKAALLMKVEYMTIVVQRELSQEKLLCTINENC